MKRRLLLSALSLSVVLAGMRPAAAQPEVVWIDEEPQEVWINEGTEELAAPAEIVEDVLPAPPVETVVLPAPRVRAVRWPRRLHRPAPVHRAPIIYHGRRHAPRIIHHGRWHAPRAGHPRHLPQVRQRHRAARVHGLPRAHRRGG